MNMYSNVISTKTGPYAKIHANNHQIFLKNNSIRNYAMFEKVD